MSYKDYNEFANPNPSIKQFLTAFNSVANECSVDGKKVGSHNLETSVTVLCDNEDDSYVLTGIGIDTLIGCGCYASPVLIIKNIDTHTPTKNNIISNDFDESDPTIYDFNEEFLKIAEECSLDGEKMNSHDIATNVLVKCENTKDNYEIVGIGVESMFGCGCWSGVKVIINKK